MTARLQCPRHRAPGEGQTSSHQLVKIIADKMTLHMSHRLPLTRLHVSPRCESLPPPCCSRAACPLLRALQLSSAVGCLWGSERGAVAKQRPWEGSGTWVCCARGRRGPRPAQQPPRIIHTRFLSFPEMRISAVQLNSRINSSLFKQICLRIGFGIPNLWWEEKNQRSDTKTGWG